MEPGLLWIGFQRLKSGVGIFIHFILFHLISLGSTYEFGAGLNMGGSLSCPCEIRHYCLTDKMIAINNNITTTTTIAAGQQAITQFRFWAELFRLSSDRTQWNILYPSLLSITIVEMPSRRNDVNCKAIRLLAKNEFGIVSEQILDTSSRIARVSSCFAYWHYRSETYGINVVSAGDCDRFYKMIKGSYDTSNWTAYDLSRPSSKPSSAMSTVIPAYIKQIFEVDKGVIKSRNGPFMECIIKLNQSGASIRFKDKDFSLNLLESVMVVGEIKERLYISEPTGAFAIECSNSRALRFLLIRLLTVSSFLQSATTNISNATHYLQKEISRVNETINSLMRSMGSLQSECELAHDLDDELEMSQLQLFTLKYRLAAICDVNFPTPSELLSKISLRTLRHLSSFGGAAICSLHLYFLCKSQFQISKRLWNYQEELMLNVSQLNTFLDSHSFESNNDIVSVLLPSGSIIHLQHAVADDVKEILCRVCDELKLDPEKYYIVKDDRNHIQLQERDYRLQKKDRSLGLTISAKMCNDGAIKAEVRAIRDKTTCVEVGDLVISVDNRLISSLKSAEEVQVLLRHGTNLVLRKRNAIVSQYVKPRPLSVPTIKTTATILNSFAPPPPPPPKTTRNRSHSMDRISDITSHTNTTQKDQQNESARSSPTRSVNRNYQTSSNNHLLRQMSRSAYEKSSKREEYRLATPNCIISVSHFSEGAEEQLLKTISELVSTEENFVRDVQKLVDQYLKPTNLPLLETADRLLRIQTSFLLALLDAAGDVARSFAVSQQQLRDSLIRISALFINKCCKFKIYSDYSAAYLRFQQNKKEKHLLYVNTDVAVYVIQQRPELQALVTEVTAFSKRSPTAVQQLVNALSANIFQFSSSASISNNIVVPKSANVIGHLWSTDRNSPLIVVVAYYDSHSAIPGLAVGADANGSGVAALLELLAVFSRFYSSNTMKPKYNMIFLLTAGGKFNYQGSRQWLEEHIDKQTEMNVELVLCLDSLGKDDSLIAHVSKMPTETSPVGRFFFLLKDAAPPNRSIEIISKKINLNADVLAWEHERFSIQRLPALTLSHFKSHSDSGRSSLLDTPSQVQMEVLEANIRTIAEALLIYVLNLSNTKCAHEENVSTCSILASKDVSRKRLSTWLQQFGSKPRSLAADSEWLIANLKDTVVRYTSGQTVVEPVSLADISLYGVLEDRLTAHRAKPAIFELLLAVAIALYLSALYFVAPMLQTFAEAALVKLKKL
ncbi:Nicalin [Dirofilaria immitis]